MITCGDHGRFFNNPPSDVHKPTNFITFHQNIQGLTHKVDELLISLSDINPQVLCVTEHHLRPDEIKMFTWGTTPWVHTIVEDYIDKVE